MYDEISPLDGRYRERLAPLGRIFSEKSLMEARCRVEARWVAALTEAGLFEPLNEGESRRLAAVEAGLSDDDYRRIKAIEAEIHHDIKACERFLVERLDLRQPQAIHFGLTSEDVNNLAYSLMLERYRRTVQLPTLRELMEALARLARQWRDAPFPARTHGQLASPTTAGKEIAVFLARLLRQYRALRGFRFRGKLDGATGNYSALDVASPDIDWPAFSRRFVEERLGLEHNPVTTQIEDHDTWAEYFALVARINTIVLDLDRDCWAYISRGYFTLAARDGEVGSSTMPHKVNPIHFENSEGNVVVANALLHALSDQLCTSRMQRDLSDSTIERNIGVALSHSHLALLETIEGLSRIELDRSACLRELEGAFELLAEPIQTLLKLAGIPDAYELLKRASRGRKLDKRGIEALLDELDLAPAIRSRIESLSVTGYVGRAPEICDHVLSDLAKEIEP